MRLLERGPRRVTLTRQGEVLFGLATRLFETETEIDRVFRDPSVIGATRLTLATNQSIAAHILPSRLATFTARFPKAEINIHTLRTADILASVRDGSTDVGIILIDPQLPVKDVDLAFIYDVLHHIGDRPAYLKALATYLKPSARIAVVEFHPDRGGHANQPELQITRPQGDALFAEEAVG